MGNGKKLLLIASTGGHLAQMYRLAPSLEASADSLWVTFRGPQSESLLEGKRVHYLPYVRSRDWLGSLRAARIINAILRRENFEGAVSTGAAISVPGLLLARAHGLPARYIESISRVQGPSLSGRILAASHVVDLKTQHSSWADRRWRPTTSVLSTYQVTTECSQTRPKLFVTLGTIQGYRFDSMIDAVLATGLADERTVWQLGDTRRTDELPGVVYDYMSAQVFSRYAQDADVVISHAGVGSLIGLLELGVYPILVTRSARRGEHVDDHQMQIARLARDVGIAAAVDAPDLTAECVVQASGKRITTLSS